MARISVAVPKGIGDAARRPFIVGREGDPDMAVVEYRIVRAVGFLDLIERLRDQKALEAVAGHEGERRLEKIEAPQRRELVQHEQQPMQVLLSMLKTPKC